MSNIIKQEISVIDKRKAQAEVIKPIYDEMVSTLGKKQAKQILKNAIIKNAINEGRILREKSDIAPHGIKGFAGSPESHSTSNQVWVT